MVVTESAFAEAWLLLKNQKEGVNFTPEEHEFITETILKMMNSEDMRMQEEGGLLFARFKNIKN